MISFEMNDCKKIGLGLTGFGIFFSFLGVIFFFDKGLLAMGNILFISGVTLTIGLKSSMQFFTKRSNFKGTVSFALGFLLVMIGWPVLGMILEAYGFMFFSVASGLHWQFLCRRYLFSDGFSNSHLLDRATLFLVQWHQTKLKIHPLTLVMVKDLTGLAPRDLPMVNLLNAKLIGTALRDLPTTSLLTKTSQEDILIITTIVGINLKASYSKTMMIISRQSDNQISEAVGEVKIEVEDQDEIDIDACVQEDTEIVSDAVAEEQKNIASEVYVSGLEESPTMELTTTLQGNIFVAGNQFCDEGVPTNCSVRGSSMGHLNIVL